jgi:glyoxylase-like metal-dependent hydrolase (beta-lactamase superfamily II)
MTITQIITRMPYDSNVYLVRGSKNAVIDCGSGDDSDYIISQIKILLGGDRLDMILLTHCHADHAGGLKDFVDEFGCPAFCGPDAKFISMGTEATLSEMLFHKDFTPVDTAELENGTVIDLGEHKLRVIYTPGHTSGGVSYYDEITRSLFSGDTLFANGVGRTDFDTGSARELVESLENLSKVDIKSLYPGHGNGSNDGNAMVRNGLHMMGV